MIIFVQSIFFPFQYFSTETKSWLSGLNEDAPARTAMVDKEKFRKFLKKKNRKIESSLKIFQHFPKFLIENFCQKSEKCESHVDELILTTGWRHCEESGKYRHLIGQHIAYILSPIEFMTHKYASYCMNHISRV